MITVCFLWSVQARNQSYQQEALAQLLCMIPHTSKHCCATYHQSICPQQLTRHDQTRGTLLSELALMWLVGDCYNARNTSHAGVLTGTAERDVRETGEVTSSQRLSAVL